MRIAKGNRDPPPLFLWPPAPDSPRFIAISQGKPKVDRKGNSERERERERDSRKLRTATRERECITSGIARRCWWIGRLLVLLATRNPLEREREREREKESVWKKKDNAESVIGKQIAEKAECWRIEGGHEATMLKTCECVISFRELVKNKNALISLP
jgi:hypothetical protein